MTVQTPKVALSDGFLGAFARIPKAQQKKGAGIHLQIPSGPDQ